MSRRIEANPSKNWLSRGHFSSDIQQEEKKVPGGSDVKEKKKESEKEIEGETKRCFSPKRAKEM